MWSRRQALRLGLVAAGGGTVSLGGCSMRPRSGKPLPYASLSAERRRPWSPPEQTAELFRPRSRHLLDNGARVTTAVLRAGDLHLPTGRLVAADPSWLTSWERSGIAPYTATVPRGTYPLTLALVRLPGHKLVAAAKLTISDAPVTAWEMALRPGEDPRALGKGEMFTVGVDVATIALFDAVALPAMVRRTRETLDPYRVLVADDPVELNDPASGANLIAFNTGWGDGGYPVWVGRTFIGAVGCFVVDMAMLAAPPTPPSGSPSRSRTATKS